MSQTQSPCHLTLKIEKRRGFCAITVRGLPLAFALISMPATKQIIMTLPESAIALAA